METDTVVFFMGRMEKNLGLDVVIDTAGELLSCEPNLHLLIGGAKGELSAEASA